MPNIAGSRSPRLARLARYGLTALVAAAAGWLGVPRIVGPVAQPITRGADEPINYEGAAFHGDQVEPLLAAEFRWPTDHITYSVDYQSAKGLNPPLSADAIRGAVQQATGWWSEGLAIDFTEVQSGALIPIRFTPIDGPQNILAQAFLNNGTLQPQSLSVDSAERWTAGAPAPNLLSLSAVLAHELGHSLGLGHDNATAMALMRPTYTAAIPRPQPRDYDRAVQLGYLRRTTLPPPGGGSGELLTFPVSAKAGDLADALKKAGYGVTPPAK